MPSKSSGKSPSGGRNKDSTLIHQEISVHLSLNRASLEHHPAAQAERCVEMPTPGREAGGALLLQHYLI